MTSLALSLSIEDTGPGISPEDQKKLFRPFAQMGHELNTQTGTGLGLAISRKYARLMGGDITVTSTVGTGTIFRLEIPVERAAIGSVVHPADGRRVTGIRSGETAPRVLIVDDQQDNRDWLAKLLTSIGFCVKEAGNGAEGIQASAEWKPRLILMDVHMPVMDGLAATRVIRSTQSQKETVIIALTAGALDDDRQAVLRSGADDFISKPCREDDLLEKIARHLKLSYEYMEGAPPVEQPVSGPRLSPERLKRLPDMLINHLHQAAPFDGDKNGLYHPMS